MDLCNLGAKSIINKMTLNKSMKVLRQSLVVIIMAKALNQLHQLVYPTINRGVSSCYEGLMSEKYPLL